MTLITDSQSPFCQAVRRLGMKKKFIAAVVLASLAFWCVPEALAATWHSGSSDLGSSVPERSARPVASSAHDHSCCPGVRSHFASLLFVMPTPAAMPCSDQHPCCAKQGRDTPPALPSANRTERRSLGALVAIVDLTHNGRTRTATKALVSNPFQSYAVRSTVLRI